MLGFSRASRAACGRAWRGLGHSPAVWPTVGQRFTRASLPTSGRRATSGRKVAPEARHVRQLPAINAGNTAATHVGPTVRSHVALCATPTRHVSGQWPRVARSARTCCRTLVAAVCACHTVTRAWRTFSRDRHVSITRRVTRG
eukprot:CAMPEP_0194755036 /NCGR_PEP_ID=MMETSP0323_2-20130528/8946_1 /TAXON_ID=2866 ORGANISM="Crypthecodinium cohnii, Strain Seligo" /NCGR_SAMPLE_ID=MMETSP0323_2 /ASSEMBLY_ACC=CAM_ASM_000346 /LENGTH=142 /DNA_ID=CAMNT_0039673881 /DNA_START=462 /DNA_END=890 /DNA_ORIENTATION=+